METITTTPESESQQQEPTRTLRLQHKKTYKRRQCTINYNNNLCKQQNNINNDVKLRTQHTAEINDTYRKKHNNQNERNNNNQYERNNNNNNQSMKPKNQEQQQ